MKQISIVLLLLTSVLIQACGGSDSNSPSPIARATALPTPTLTATPIVSTQRAQLPIPEPLPITAQQPVTLSESTYQFDHWRYSLNNDNTLASVDYNVLDSTTLPVWVMENEYLKVVLMPQFGGRIVSIVNKITGHEELYQNPVLSPYLNNTNIFYYNWLMIFGGIFPTFPEPEHGKSWLVPWDVEIVSAGGDIATLRMSYHDTIDYVRAPAQYTKGRTNMICTYTVTLKAGRSALDTIVTIENPNDTAKQYEYWTNTAPAPGSQAGSTVSGNIRPGETALTAGYEIIADVTNLRPARPGPGSAYGIVAANNTQQWDNIKFFSNHVVDGIAYPAPDISHSNFWGAINHDMEEGFFRVADNNLTPGLKIFTFGHDNTINADPRGTTNNRLNWERPAVELWAGASEEFFFNRTIAANSTYHINETYSPSVGMNNVTHASDDVLVNVTDNQVDLYFMTPDQDYRVQLISNDTTVLDTNITPDPLNGNRLTGDFTSGSLVISDSMDNTVIIVYL